MLFAVIAKKIAYVQAGFWLFSSTVKQSRLVAHPDFTNNSRPQTVHCSVLFYQLH